MPPLVATPSAGYSEKLGATKHPGLQQLALALHLWPQTSLNPFTADYF